MPRNPTDRPPVVAFHIHEWKRSVLEAYFPQWDFHYMPFFVGDKAFVDVWQARIAALENPSVIVWGPNLPQAAADFCARRNIPVHFVEDGFLRSVGGSAGQSAPFSLTIDRQRPFFDSRGPSDLEDLLKTYDFDADPALIERAQAGIAAMLQHRIGKYGGQPARGTGDLPPRPGRKVLVVGRSKAMPDPLRASDVLNNACCWQRENPARRSSTSRIRRTKACSDRFRSGQWQICVASNCPWPCRSLTPSATSTITARRLPGVCAK
jgi:hypothetical protein